MNAALDERCARSEKGVVWSAARVSRAWGAAIEGNGHIACGRFPKFHRVFLVRDPGTLKSDIVSTKHPQ